MYHINLGIFIFTKIHLITLNFINVFLCNLNSFKLNIILLIIYLYCLYYNKFLWKINLLSIFVFIGINDKYNFILHNFYLGYYKIHPVLLYFSLIILFCYITELKIFNNFYFFIICVLLLVTFILGSLWSLSQSIWGKYWSNDSIEIILILFFICGIIFMHLLFNLHKNYLIFNLLQSCLLLILLRLNFIYTKHNFFQKTLNFENLFYLFYSFIISKFYIKIIKNKFLKKISIFTILIYLCIIQIFLNLININFFKLFNNWFIFFCSLYFLLISYLTINIFFLHLIILSIFLLFNNFYINFYKYNFINLYKTTKHIHYFNYQKNIQYYMYYKNIFKKIIFNFKNNFSSLKENSFYLKQKNFIIYMVNFF